MRYHQEAFDRMIDELFNFDYLLATYIIKVLEKKGLTLSAEDQESVRLQLSRRSDDNDFEIDLPGIKDIELLDSDFDDLDKFMNDSAQLSIKFFHDYIEMSVNATLKAIEESKEEIRKDRSSINKRISKSISEVWSIPLNSLEDLVLFSDEIGSKLNLELRKKQTKVSSLVEVVSRLHARACQICFEIILLLRAGFADGANARWRTLYEIVVIAYFIRDNGEEIACKYLEHQAIETYKSALRYNKYHIDLKNEPITEKELEDIANKKNELLIKYGKEFYNEYGWAARCFVNNNNPNFFLISESVSLDQLTPYYKLASSNVHASSNVFFNSLGLLEKDKGFLLTGPSVYGLETPADLTATSIIQLTILYLNMEYTIDNISYSRVLKTLADNVSQKVHEAMMTTLSF